MDSVSTFSETTGTVYDMKNVGTSEKKVFNDLCGSYSTFSTWSMCQNTQDFVRTWLLYKHTSHVSTQACHKILTRLGVNDSTIVRKSCTLFFAPVVTVRLVCMFIINVEHSVDIFVYHGCGIHVLWYYATRDMLACQACHLNMVRLCHKLKCVAGTVHVACILGESVVNQ